MLKRISIIKGNLTAYQTGKSSCDKAKKKKGICNNISNKMQ